MTTPVAGSLDAARVLEPSLASAIRRTAGRALAVAALALAGLLVFVLLPGQNVPAVTTDPYLLPAVPAAHSWHPHGPNRPVQSADPAPPSRTGYVTHAGR
jgi:hypothetical protein